MKPFKPFLDFIKSNPASNHSSRVINDWGSKPRYKGSVLPATMTFGTQAVNSESAMQTGIVTNVGTFPLPIVSIRSSGDYIVTNNCPAVLQPGESCQISVVFRPRISGLNTGGIYVNTGDAAGTEYIELIGAASGTAPPPPPPPPSLTLSISDATIEELATAIFATLDNTNQISAFTFPSSIEMGNTAVQELRVYANSPVTLTALPATAGDFSMVYGNPPVTAPVTLTAGQSLPVEITFDPSVVGSRTATLSLTTNTGTMSLPLAATATAVAVNEPPTIGGVPTTPPVVMIGTNYPLANLAFGDPNGNTLLVTITATNGTVGGLTDADTGTAGIQLTGTPAAVSDAFANATFNPTAVGTSVITISANDGTNPATVATYTITATDEPPPLPRITISGNQFIRNGQPYRLNGVNWAGFQSNTMSLHGMWRRNWKLMFDDLQAMGFNLIRLPFSREGFSQVRSLTDLGAIGVGMGPGTPATDLNPDWHGKNNFECLTMVIRECTIRGIYVLLDHHNNAYDTLDGLPISGSWDVSGWHALWGEMATRFGNNTTVIGADLYNEPHNVAWGTLRTLFQDCGNHIHTIAPDWLIFCGGGADGAGDNYWWGGNLKGVATQPVVLNTPNRVVYTPHEYGHSVGGGQSWLATTGNTPANWPRNVNTIRSAYWAYIFEQNIAPVLVGEWGGKLGFNNDGTVNSGDANATFERQWLLNLINHMNGDFDGDGDSELTAGKVGMSSTFWTFNGNSGDTGGLTSDQTFNVVQGKVDLLDPLFTPTFTTPVESGRITIQGNQFIRNGQPFRLKSTSWFGAELPTMVPHPLWGRNWVEQIDNIQALGFNSVRLPFSTQGFFNMNNMPDQNNFGGVNDDLLGKTVYQIFDMIIDELSSRGIYTILDHHRNNWDTQDGTPVRAGYSEANWHILWGQMATRYGNNPWVVGADIYNEPIETPWSQWATWVEACANHIHTIAPNWLIFVQGAARDETLNGGDNFFWAGGNLEAVRTRPITLNLPNRVAYSPHEYAHSVYASNWLRVEGQPTPANWPLNQYAKRRYHYAFIFEEGIAPIWVGEFGGRLGYLNTAPGNSDGTANGLYEREWYTTIINHMNGDFDGNGTTNLTSPSMGMSFCHWCYNANSADTGGLMYDDWSGIHTQRRALLDPLMNFTGV